MRDNAKGGALTEVTFFILLALHRPRHGYGIMQFIQDHTGGRLVLGAGTLYGALTTLQEKGWIEPCGEESDRRKLFQITTLGKTVAQVELARLRRLADTATTIIGGDTHD